MEKYSIIEGKVTEIRTNKANLIEFSRLANEI